MRSILFLSILAAPLSALLVSTPASRPFTTPSCLTNADTVTIVEQAVTRHLSLGDSAELVTNGVPYNPSIVQAITADSTCSAVIAAYNALLDSTEVSKQLQSAFVVQAGSAYALRGPVNANYPTAYFYFDSTFAFRFSLSELN